MKYQAPELTLYLQDLYLQAYIGHWIYFNFTGTELAELKSYTIYHLLVNYRSKIRKTKLNPLVKDEWSKIERCTMRQLTKTSILLKRNTKIKFESHRTLVYKKLPETLFNFPRSTCEIDK